jgi:hypothetical protein
MRNECLEERIKNEYFRKVPLVEKTMTLPKHGPLFRNCPHKKIVAIAVLHLLHLEPAQATSACILHFRTGPSHNWLHSALEPSQAASACCAQVATGGCSGPHSAATRTKKTKRRNYCGGG